MRQTCVLFVISILIFKFSLSGEVIINEIHYDPDIKTEHVEFIELFNTDEADVDISGWQIGGGVNFTFPSKTTIPAKGFIVVAHDPTAFKLKFKTDALGPWQGRLDNESESVLIYDLDNKLIDRVDYKLGFPWPIVGDAPGYSIELVNPFLDNNLGASWRPSVARFGYNTDTNSFQSIILLPAGAEWKFLKGTNTPPGITNQWLLLEYDDSDWISGKAPIGYGEKFLSTILDDMRGNYSTIFLRKSVSITNMDLIGSLLVEIMYDDGFCLWINGKLAISKNAPQTLNYNSCATTARESYDYEKIIIPNPQDFLANGSNQISILLLNSHITNSSDAFVDIQISAEPFSSIHGPTPGRQNSVYQSLDKIPPALRQVSHYPKQPHSNEPVKVTAKATDLDGVATVQLHIQIVEPGNYIEVTDPEYLTNWITFAMNDSGIDGDQTAGDSVYTIIIPPEIQKHRRLIRYKITAIDNLGNSITVPYPEDQQPNFAYFIYDGVPEWRGANRPGTTPIVTYSSNAMNQLPVYHLLAKRTAIEDCTWKSKYTGDLYKWSGTLVYDGTVYDNIHYRARGGVWRYAMGKNMWKFDFNRAHWFQAKDNYGKKYQTKWSKLNLGACIQQGDYGHRGEQGMFESVGFRLFNLVGVPAPLTHWIQLRIIDDSIEANPTNQYEGDFWGLYLAVEQPDGRFLKEHNLPDGNFYKMEGGSGTLNNIGDNGPSDASDLTAFLSKYKNESPDEYWWRTNLNLSSYYSYRSIVEAIHHYDIDESAGKNYFYFHDPITSLWSVHPWDLDLTWADTMYGGGNEPFKSRVLTKTSFALEYRNRLREICDLLFNTNQAWLLIQEYASIIHDFSNNPCITGADRAMWDYNPIMISSYVNKTKAGQGLFYQKASTKDFPGMVEIMKAYVVSRSRWIHSNILNDPEIPAKPSISRVGSGAYYANKLIFQCSQYQGTHPFAALKWRIARVGPGSITNKFFYEIQTKWESSDITEFTNQIQIPIESVEVGATYRVRVKMKDSTGRWSHWSEPIEFSVAEPDTVLQLRQWLKITEIMYHPPQGDAFEFLEFYNSSSNIILDLSGVNISSGIQFTFPQNTIIPPESFLILCKDSPENGFASFKSVYQIPDGTTLVGPFVGKLANEGDTITIKSSPNGAILFNIVYNDTPPWPQLADGTGFSLVLDVKDFNHANHPFAWRPSSRIGGSPGSKDPDDKPAIVFNEIYFPATQNTDDSPWIEIMCLNSGPINTDNVFISDDPTNLAKLPLPDCKLDHGEFVVVTNIGVLIPALENNKNLYLSSKEGQDVFKIHDHIKCQPIPQGYSLARNPDGTGWYILSTPTMGSKNKGFSPPVFINEVNCELVNSNNEYSLQFIELKKSETISNLITLTNFKIQIAGDIELKIPTSMLTNDNPIIVAVPFDPDNSYSVQLFENRFTNIPPTMTLIGPWLQKSAFPSSILIELIITNEAPNKLKPYVLDSFWLAHQSIATQYSQNKSINYQRINPGISGYHPWNWLLTIPTPGLTPRSEPVLQAARDGNKQNIVFSFFHIFTEPQIIEESSDLLHWFPIFTNHTANPIMLEITKDSDFYKKSGLFLRMRNTVQEW